MTTTIAPRGTCIETGYAGSALEPPESGDLHVVFGVPQGALVAVIDGLGHGPEAACAARLAKAALEGDARRPLAEIVRGCHEALRGTRGVVLSAAVIDVFTSSSSWVGVGNVEGVLLREGRSVAAIVPRGGVLGHRLPELRIVSVPLVPDDVLILATDGIRSGFLEGLDLSASAQQIADTILRLHGRGSDDALVLCLRYFGGAP